MAKDMCAGSFVPFVTGLGMAYTHRVARRSAVPTTS